MLRCCRPFFRRDALRVSLGMVVSWIGCSGLGAVTIHDTFGPGLSTDGNYSTGCNAAICIQATTFVPSVTARLETVVVPLGVLSGYPFRSGLTPMKNPTLCSSHGPSRHPPLRRPTSHSPRLLVHYCYLVRRIGHCIRPLQTHSHHLPSSGASSVQRSRAEYGVERR